MWLVTKFVHRISSPCPSSDYLLHPAASSRGQPPHMTLTEDQCLGGFHQQGEPAEDGKREENEVRAFLSLATSQVSVTGCASLWKTTGTPKVADSTWLSLSETLKLLPPLAPPGPQAVTSWLPPALNHWITIPLWKLLIKLWVLLMDTDNSKRQKWYWSPRLLVLGVESFLYTHFTFIHMFIN